MTMFERCLRYFQMHDPCLRRCPSLIICILLLYIVISYKYTFPHTKISRLCESCSLLFLPQSRDKRLDIDELGVRCILEYSEGIVLQVQNFFQNLFVSDFRNLIVFEFLFCFPNCFLNANHLWFINLIEMALVSD